MFLKIVFRNYPDLLEKNLKDYNWIITIGDNASVDDTLETAKAIREKK